MNLAEQHKSVYSYVGQRIRDRRKTLHLNQSQLANLMGFSYQQMQKYESGASQLSVSKLLKFSKILNVPPNYFYDGLEVEQMIGKGIATDLIQKTRIEPLRILLVEDHPGDVIVFKKSLAKCSERAEIKVIHDAEMVMDFLQNHHTKYRKPSPDIIVMELSLPKINGMQLLKNIKRNPQMQQIPVIILTNSISVKDMLESYRAGAAGFIQKSTEFEDYTESLEIALKYWSQVVALPCA